MRSSNSAGPPAPDSDRMPDHSLADAGQPDAGSPGADPIGAGTLGPGPVGNDPAVRRAGATTVLDDVSVRVAELQQLLLETQSVEDFLQGLVRLAARLVVGGLSCGMTLEQSGKPLTAACSDQVASGADEVQYLLGEGPCLEALRRQRPVRIDDTAGRCPWPKFGEQAVAYGIRSCLSLPLVAGRQPIGALNLYSPLPGAFGVTETQRAKNFAKDASGALAIATKLASYTVLTSQLRASLATRSVIDQALGIIMAQRHCAQAQAFAILRTASQNRNVKLHEVARQIVTRISGQPPDPPPFNGT